jgi:hypothetical protein
VTVIRENNSNHGKKFCTAEKWNKWSGDKKNLRGKASILVKIASGGCLPLLP